MNKSDSRYPEVDKLPATLMWLLAVKAIIFLLAVTTIGLLFAR